MDPVNKYSSIREGGQSWESTTNDKTREQNSWQIAEGKTGLWLVPAPDMEGCLSSGRKFKCALPPETWQCKQFWGLQRTNAHSSPDSMWTCFLWPPKPPVSPLCHLVTNARLQDKKAQELCFVSTEFAKRLTGSKRIKNIWKRGSCVFLECVGSWAVGRGQLDLLLCWKALFPWWVKQVNGIGLVESLLAALEAHIGTAGVLLLQVFPIRVGYGEGNRKRTWVRLHSVQQKLIEILMYTNPCSRCSGEQN